MFGAAVTNCHMRVPVSSNPKYRSVSRFNSTDSLSRKRTSTCGKTSARSANDTIGPAPQLSVVGPLLFLCFFFNLRGSILPGIHNIRHADYEAAKLPVGCPCLQADCLRAAETL